MELVAWLLELVEGVAPLRARLLRTITAKTATTPTMKATTRLFMLFPPYLPLQAYISIVRITLAGLPTTTALSGTSLVTTLAAPTTAFSPIVTPDRIVAVAPIQAFFLMWTGFQMTIILSFRSWLTVIKLTRGAI